MTHAEEILKFCMQFSGVSYDFPFGEDTLVVRVMGKIFLLCSISDIPLSINLKAQPQKAIEWREEFDTILPGYHMNKKHWNTVLLDGSLKNQFVQEMISHSYECVVNGLPKKIKNELEQLN